MSSESRQFYFFYALIVFVYSLNIGGNAIWTTHEAYYAEAVREMLETGNWSEVFFNYEHRFQKPPVTYWLMASSAALLGLSEFALRLPMVVCSLFTVLLVYGLGRLLYNEKVGLLSMLIFSMSLQFVWFRSYASPEIPLTMLFTLSIFLFFKGLHSSKNSWLYVSYAVLGIVALTKGFPYILLFFSIVIIHNVFENKKKGDYFIRPMFLLKGFLISTIIGFSWPLYMTLVHGDSYLEVFVSETLGRALSHTTSNGFWESLIFYPQIILWSFFPFSLILYYVLFKALSDIEYRRALFLPFIWLGLFLLVFTISSGKLPTYILQAHPAMALIVGYMLAQPVPLQRFEQLVFKISLWLPGLLMLLLAGLIINRLHLSLGYYALLIPAVIQFYLSWGKKGYHLQILTIWFISIFSMTVVFLGLLPWVEQFRPYHQIQKTIKAEVREPGTPLYIEGRFLDNMPFYAGRKVYGGHEWTKEKIQSQPGKKLVLRRKEIDSFTTFGMTSKSEVLWQGPIHAKGPEDHFFKFIRDCYLYSNGDSTRFTNYQLLITKN